MLYSIRARANGANVVPYSYLNYILLLLLFSQKKKKYKIFRIERFTLLPAYAN